MPPTVRREYAALAARYDARWAAYNARTLALLRPYVEGRDLGTVVDLGCGTANLLAALGDWGARFGRYVGMDLSPEMLARAAKKVARSPSPAALLAADAASLPLRDACADAAVSASTLHDWPEPAAALAEARRILRPGGRLLLLDWSRERWTMKALNLGLRIARNPFHRMHSPGEAEALIQHAGFRIARRERRAVGWMWGMMLFDAIRD
jgi:ubiquinone/menaquinone biosynthesis C-methylase UbiE